MPFKKEVLEGAREIRSHLAELIREGSGALDGKLGALIERGTAGERVDNEIIDLLREDERTRTWLQEYLGDESLLATRSYSPTPGKGEPVKTQRFRCPEGDYEWRRRSIGQAIPNCPNHDIPLEPA